MRQLRPGFGSVRVFSALVLIVASGVAAFGQTKVALRERVDSRRVVRSSHEMTADGVFFLDPPDDTKGAKKDDLKPESLKVQARTKLIVQDKWAVTEGIGGSTAGTLVSRRVVESATSDIGGEIRPGASRLRPTRRRFLVDIQEELARSGSLDGPLTRSELESLSTPGDAVSLWTLLPKREVAMGDTYALDNIGAKSLSLFDSIAVNALEGKVEELTDSLVRIRLSGEVRGAVLGAEGIMKIKGELRFNREIGLVEFLRVERDESRRPGTVEAGLEIHSTLEVQRAETNAPAPLLADDGMDWPKAIAPEHLRLEWVEPNGLFRLEHDRDWHLTWMDTQESVLKRVDRGGTVIAQCNLKRAPSVGAGRHQDPAQFREDVREALGKQFQGVFGEGVLERPEGQGYGYKLAVHGVVQDLPVVWYYYLMASPQGDQYAATVTTTLTESQSGDKPGLALMESLRWSDRTENQEKAK